MKLEETLLKLCVAKGLTVGTAESCTGGAIAARITTVAGASNYFKGGIVAYHENVKEKVLNVPKQVLERFGVVSKEVAFSMAENALSCLECDIAIATTGVAGPEGGSKETPVGTVFVSIRGKSHFFEGEEIKLQLQGDRQSIIEQTVDEVLENLIQKLTSLPA